jgi:hypothetical protein
MIYRILVRLKYIIWTLVPLRLWTMCSKLIRDYRNLQYSEKFKSYGDLNPDLTFYVIRRRPPGNGLFSNVQHVVTGIIFAISKKYVPVVDMENYWMDEMNELEKINDTYNSWCYLFQQVSPYSLEEVYKSKNVILSKGSRILGDAHWIYDKNFSYVKDVKNLNLISNVIAQYIKFNSSFMNNLQQTQERIMWDPKSTIGVFIRGTAYRNGHVGIANIPQIEFVSSSINKICNEENLSTVFLATEDYKIFKEISERLPANIVVKNLRFNNNLNHIGSILNHRVNSDNSIRMGYRKNLDYLTEIMLVCKSSHVICTVSNASAFIIANRYSNNCHTNLILNNKIILV